jgi:hypothetical protein
VPNTTTQHAYRIPPRCALQEALDTLVVRIVEEKAAPLVASVVEPPECSEIPDPADLISVLDKYLAMLRPVKDILDDFVAKVLQELPVKTHSQNSLDALSSILQVCPCLGYLSLAHATTADWHKLTSTARR